MYIIPCGWLSPLEIICFQFVGSRKMSSSLVCNCARRHLNTQISACIAIFFFFFPILICILYGTYMYNIYVCVLTAIQCYVFRKQSAGLCNIANIYMLQCRSISSSSSTPSPFFHFANFTEILIEIAGKPSELCITRAHTFMEFKGDKKLTKKKRKRKYKEW